jgi:anti-anti-sigma regulatory factor
MQIFRLTERDLDDGQHEVQVEGELDLAVAEQLRELLARLDGERSTSPLVSSSTRLGSR